MFKRLSVVIGVAVLLAGAFGCKTQTQTSQLPDGVVASLNGTNISVDEYRAFCGGTIPDSPAGKKNTLADLINVRLTSGLAKKDGLMTDPAVVSEVLQERNGRLAEMLKDKIVSETELEEGDAPEPDVEGGVVVELYQLVTRDMAAAEKARAEVLSGKKFEEVADRYSTGISAKGGGYLGEVYLPGSVYSFGVRAIINKLKPGEVSAVVKEEMGYAIFMVKTRKEPEEFVQQMRDKLAEDALKKKKEKAVLDLIKKLRRENKVEYNERFFSGKDFGGWVVKVNGQVLSVETKAIEATDPFHQPHQGVGVEELRVTADRQINEILLSQEAQRLNLHMTPEFLIESRQNEEQVLANTYIKRKVWPATPMTEPELKGFYEKNKAKYARPTKAHVQRILVFTQGEADKLLKRIKDGEDFSALALEYSKDKSAAKGGDVGYIYEGNTIEPLNSTIFKLKQGETTGVIKTQYGFEIVKVVDIRLGGIVPMDEMMDKLIKKAEMERKGNAVNEFYKQLREAADLQVNSELMSKLKE